MNSDNKFKWLMEHFFKKNLYKSNKWRINLYSLKYKKLNLFISTHDIVLVLGYNMVHITRLSLFTYFVCTIIPQSHWWQDCDLWRWVVRGKLMITSMAVIMIFNKPIRGKLLHVNTIAGVRFWRWCFKQWRSRNLNYRHSLKIFNLIWGLDFICCILSHI